MYTVRLIADDDELAKLHSAVAPSFGPTVQCSPDAGFPDLDALRRAYRVYGARRGRRWVALAAVSARGQIAWLNGTPDHFAEAGVALIRAVFDDFGTSWGDMRNPDLRAALVAASGGRLAEDGTRLSWIG